jgi:hypothetical protein
MPHAELWIVRAYGADTNDDSIDHRSQPMQMQQADASIDVVRASGRRRDPTVDGLPDLTNDDEIVNNSGAQRAEQILPWRRQRS